MNRAADHRVGASIIDRVRGQLGLLFLIALAYIPPLTSAPGRMPSDTKLFLYLNPDRLVSDAIWMWDPRQFGGWVPHQMVGYLWPAGPWFWFFDKVGVPDWVAHRLWIGTILLAASTGMRWCARRLGLSREASLVSAIAYGLSPFLLAYVGRTSGLLLPWAGLGWMLGIIVSATRRPTSSWREPAQLALVLACLGGLNATAIILIAPPLLLWLADSVARREISPTRCAVLVGRITLLSIGTALWWLAGLIFQGRYGANVLNYSETLDAVTFTSTASEVLRGAGYWLFYVVERDGPLTAASGRYQTSLITVVISFAVVIIALTGLILVRWRARRFAAWCLIVGVVISVGVHPITAPSPLMSLVADHPTSTWALAFRSSTRAVPVLLVALSLGAGAFATWFAASFPRHQHLGRLALIGLLVANLPAIGRGQLVNPVQSREQDVPQPWLDAAADLDAGIDDGGRVLQLPGTEFGVHRWGNLVDPLLPGITDRPVITRDLVPLGSPGAMDLLYALDDRIQDGTLDATALAPIARLLGVDDVLIAGDVAYERYRTRHPAAVTEWLSEAADLGSVTIYGAATANEAAGVVDEADLVARSSAMPIPPVAITEIDHPVAIVRAKERDVLVVGSGMGVVDAAEAGLIDGTELIRYSASLDDPAGERAATVIVTDTNRKQAHQWRGSRDVLGMTEDSGPAVLDDDLADHRLPVFPDLPADRFTRAEQRGPVTAIASAYGEPITYRPENRAVRAIDGDPATAWLVADRAEPVGQRIRLTTSDGSAIRSVRLLQDQTAGATRWITSVILRSEAGEQRIELDEPSRSGPGQIVDIGPDAGSTVEIEIAATSTGERPVYPGFGPVGFAEIHLDDRAPTTEVVVLPADTESVTGSSRAADDTSIVLTRWRAEASDPVRNDPESSIVREWALGRPGDFSLTGTARLDARVSDRNLAELFDFPVVPYSSGSAAGEPGAAAWAAFDGDPTTGWVAAIGVEQPTIAVEFLEPRTITSIGVSVDLAGDRSTPTSVTVLGDGAELEVPLLLDDAGTARLEFPAITTSAIGLRFAVSSPVIESDLRTGEPVALPIGVDTISIEGVPMLTARFEAGVCRSDLLSLNGRPVPVRLAGDVDELLGGGALAVTTCDGEAVALAAGVQRLTTSTGAETAIVIDQLVARTSEASARGTGGRMPTARVIDSSRVTRTVEVGPCPEGCWVVHGEGWNPGWRAMVEGSSLGEPVVVDGGFNGWWLTPTDTPVTVEIRWTPQGMMWPAFAISLFVVAASVALAIGRRRHVFTGVDHQRHRPAVSVDSGGPTTRPLARKRPSALVVAALGVLGAVLVQPVWGVAGLAIGIIALVVGRRDLIVWAGLGIVGGIAAFYAWTVQRYHPLPGYGWVVNIDEMHRPAMFAVVLLAVGLSFRDESTATDPEVPSG